jgi:hypothetical protein
MAIPRCGTLTPRVVGKRAYYDASRLEHPTLFALLAARGYATVGEPRIERRGIATAFGRVIHRWSVEVQKLASGQAARP